ncbi:MAG: hypothetical protein IT517_19500 [Burkholderiales bacterium]|nr:hypothetical protein [Burkholderiales bacterium]
MARIVAGLFEDQVAAEQAIARLREMGAPHGAVSTFVVSPPGMHHGLPLGGDQPADPEARGGEDGAIRGAAIGGAAGIAAGLAMAPLVGPVGIAAGIGAGAYVGALAGAGSAMGDETKQQPTARPGGVMVAVNVDGTQPQPVVEALHAAGATHVEIDEGEWRDGDWVDFDPVSPPKNVVGRGAGTNYPT